MSLLNKDSIVIACDPSFRSSGYAIFKGEKLLSFGTIKTSTKDENRFELIGLRFCEVLMRHEPDILVIETQFISPKFSNINTLRVVEVKGFIEGLFMYRRIQKGVHTTIVEVAPTEAKKFIGVIGREDTKKQVKSLVEQRFPEIKKINQDESDAVAIGLTGIHKFNSQNVLKKYKNKI